ncbi:pirin family protein [Pontibacter fetidus]|uniref:Pirin family protein n=1 Tax=Pontibacter fetidus TaxID=2700082 RepID=A0A6B2H7S3_9BACT|nr:pirin family protein [Pontibacter fetidus]NDK55362.1 pirin family protein [Pontibacter fetidus]
MKNRTVARLLYAEEVDMNGAPVRQPFPTGQVDQIDPFLMLHHVTTISPDIDPGKAGIGPHPHRGFSPVTFIYKGGVHHRDSRRNNSVVYEGGTQWMDAGMGIMHSERPPHDIQERGGVQEIIQIWVNLPRKYKMSQPYYQPLHANETPVVTGEGYEVQVVTGRFQEIKGPIRTLTPLLILRLTLKAGATIEVPIPESYHAVLYLLDGQIFLKGHGMIEGHYAVELNSDGEGCTLTAKQDTRILLLAGEPIDEEVSMYGPFVMNTQLEVMQAMRDYQLGKMGILIED